MSSREAELVKAARRTFSQYGVQRSSMNDVAKEAGVSRQTLYNVFANKEELLRATIRLQNVYYMERIAEESEGKDDLSDRLNVIFKYLVVKPFENTHESGHANDIIEGFNQAARDEIHKGYELYRKAIEKTLRPYDDAIKAKGITVKNMSDLLLKAALGLKLRASNRRNLATLLDVQVKMVVDFVEAETLA